MTRIARPTTDLEALRRVALACVALAIPVAVVSIALGLLAVGDLEALIFGDVDTILRSGPQAAPLWRWSMLTDVFYSYVLLAPLALYGHRLLRERRPWLADLTLIAAFAYICFGAASAAILGIAGSALIGSYAAASPAEQAQIAASFTLLRDVFYFGIWQTFDAIAAGTWLLGTGWLLLADRPTLGRLLVVLGAGFWAVAITTMMGIHSLIVLGSIFVGTVVLCLGWVVVDRRRGAWGLRN